MTVYVDELRNWGAPWRGGMSCHLYADTDAEMFGFARKLGLPSRWLDYKNPVLPHFDLSPSWRKKALEMGAVEVENLFTGNFILNRRAVRLIKNPS